MIINKMGSYHAKFGRNNQDSGFEIEGFSCVADGCGEGKHSEVGTKLFVRKLYEILSKMTIPFEKRSDSEMTDLVKDAFKNSLIALMHWSLRGVNLWAPSLTDHLSPCNIYTGSDKYKQFVKDINDYYLFTILLLEEGEEFWRLSVAGDGFIITQDHEDDVKFINIDYTDDPMYLGYSYIDKEYLDFTNGQEIFWEYPIQTFKYDKEQYKSIGIASDGLRYIIGSEHEDEFKEVLLKKKDYLMKRFINKLNYQSQKYGGSGFFKDDITITMR